MELITTERDIEETVMKTSHGVRTGFSLLELLTVVTIIGIIASLVIYRIAPGVDFTKTNSCAHNRSEINSAIERWYIEKNTWPAADLTDLGGDMSYFPAGIPNCPVSGGTYTLDPVTKRVSGHTTSTIPGDH